MDSFCVRLLPHVNANWEIGAQGAVDQKGGAFVGWAS